MDRKFYSVHQTAAVLGCSVNKVRAMVKSGELVHLRSGKLIRIPGWALDQLCPQPETSGEPEEWAIPSTGR